MAQIDPPVCTDPDAVAVTCGVASTLAVAWPFSATLWGLAAALSVMVRAALRLPEACGAKATATEHVAAGATVAPLHVSPLVAKSSAFVPAMVIEPTARPALPELVTVTFCVELAVPTV